MMKFNRQFNFRIVFNAIILLLNLNLFKSEDNVNPMGFIKIEVKEDKDYSVSFLKNNKNEMSTQV